MTTARFIAVLVKRNSATASGSTTSAFLGSTPRSFDASSIAGRQASELWVLSATARVGIIARTKRAGRSEEHTSELQSLMRLSYAVFCLQKQTNIIFNRSTYSS